MRNLRLSEVHLILALALYAATAFFLGEGDLRPFALLSLPLGLGYTLIRTPFAAFPQHPPDR